MDADATLVRHAPSLRATTLPRGEADRHGVALWAFLAVVVAHWGEHLFQAWQVWVLGWPRPHSLGLLGRAWPWLVHSEWLHYGYALVMLIGLWALRGAFAGSARTWWMASFWLQAWHHLEHLLLLVQAQTGWRLDGGPAPCSLIQLVAPRIELHLFYNTLVFAPMVVAMVLRARERNT